MGNKSRYIQFDEKFLPKSTEQCSAASLLKTLCIMRPRIILFMYTSWTRESSGFVNSKVS